MAQKKQPYSRYMMTLVRSFLCPGKALMLFLVVCIAFHFTVGHTGAEKLQKTTAQQKQKPSDARITIDYVSFPDVLKQYEVYPWETLKIDRFRQAYSHMLAVGNREEWIRSLKGTGNLNKMVYAFREHFLLIASCKPHACDSSQILILFSPKSLKCWSIYSEEGKFEYLGNPDASMQNLLKILLVEEYKDIYKGQ
jgi:hypothetical protein